jgi:hypothetical protein
MVLNFDDSLNAKARDSFNTTNNTTNTANIQAAVSDVGNDHSGNTSANAWFSGNTDSSTDNSTNGSYNSHEFTSNVDSGNTLDVTRTDDHSINVGNRSYNLGSGDGSGAAAEGGAAAGSATVVDQSVNADVHSFGPSFIYSSPDAVVASGAGSLAAGDDISIHEDVDGSENISAWGGDVNLGNTTTIDTTIGSNNDYTDNSQYTNDSTHVYVDDSFNQLSSSFDATDSFNSETNDISHTDVDADVNVVSDSFLSGIADIQM